jgi:hypothetical protein
MTPRSLADRLLSPAGFGLALLLFLLPFATVSCGSTDQQSPFTVDFTFTGLDLVTGGAPEISGTVPDDNGSPMSVDGASDDAGFAQQFGRPVQPLALVAAIALLVGMVGAFTLPIALRGRVSASVALGALVLLLVEVLAVLPARAASELSRTLPDPGLATHTTPAFGFYLTVVVLAALVVREFVVAGGPTPTTQSTTEANGPPGG